MKHLVLSTLLLISVSTQAQTVSDVIDVIHYDFTIELNDSNDVITGTADVTFVFRNDAHTFALDLIEKGRDGRGMVVSSVSRSGQPLVFSHDDSKVRIQLPAEAAKGTQHTVHIAYAGIPADGLIISKNKYGDRTFFADNWPSRGRNWLPVIDHPGDKATVDFSVIAPLHYDVVANGVRKEETYLNENQKLTRYEEDVEIAPKVMVIGVARFAMQRSGLVGHVPVEAWVYPQNRREGFHDYALAMDALQFFIDRIGPYPYDKLANVQSKTTFGGLENANTIFYFENSVTGNRTSEGLIAHEVAHQWFGNSATEKDWPHLWLSEGFATYFAHLYAEFKHGVDARRAGMKENRDAVIAFARKNKTPVVNTSEKDPMNLLNANTYQKAGWVLHMLRMEIGDDLFWKGIREYYRRFGGAHADTQDFQLTMERSSGHDLERFFQQWLYRPRHPVLAVSHRFDAADQAVQVTVRQTQEGEPFVFPLEIRLTGPDGQATLEKVNINKREAVFSLNTGWKPISVEIDPLVNLLFEDKSTD